MPVPLLVTLMTSDSLKGTPTPNTTASHGPPHKIPGTHRVLQGIPNSPCNRKAWTPRQDVRAQEMFQAFWTVSHWVSCKILFLSSPRFKHVLIQFDSSLYISYVSCLYLSCSWTIENKLCRCSDYTMASGPLYSCRDSPCIEKTRKLKITS